MGLDIRYCRKATKIVTVPPDEDNDEGVRAYVNSDFRDHADGMEDGRYEVEFEGHFHAGSYGGYNRWRNALCLAVKGMTADEFWKSGSPPGPFTELINFSDCEGVIGPKTCAKLADDFACYVGDPVPDDYGRWDNFKTAFETAADGGFVMFT